MNSRLKELGLENIVFLVVVPATALIYHLGFISFYIYSIGWGEAHSYQWWCQAFLGQIGIAILLLSPITFPILIEVVIGYWMSKQYLSMVMEFAVQPAYFLFSVPGFLWAFDNLPIWNSLLVFLGFLAGWFICRLHVSWFTILAQLLYWKARLPRIFNRKILRGNFDYWSTRASRRVTYLKRK